MLRPTFLSFETAKQALNASQRGLDTVGHNIANAQTPGYTRQRVDQVSISSGGYAAKYQIRGGGSQFSGQGAQVTGVSQIRDPFLDNRYRNEASNYGQQAITSKGLTDLEDVLDEISNKGLSGQLGEFIKDLTQYMTDASSPEFATVVRSSAAKLVQMMNKTASELNEVMSQQKGDLETALSTDVNVVLEQIAQLNRTIREDNIYGNPSNELNDERNMLIDRLSEFLPIKVVNTPEKITDDLTISNLSIVLMDNSTTPASEIPLVDKTEFNPLKYVDHSLEKPPGEGVSISIRGNGKDIDLTNTLSGGAIRGYMDILNGKGSFAGNMENDFRGIPYYQKQLDTLASTFASVMNRLNSVYPEDDHGSTVVVDMNKNLFVNSDDNSTDKITALNIKISDMWKNEASYFTTSKQDPAVPEKVLDEHGNQKYDPISGQPIFKTTAKTDNLAKFIETLKGSVPFSGLDGDGKNVPLFNGSFQEFLGSVNGDLALDQQLTTTLLKSSNNIIHGFADQRDAVSAVSIDEEAMSMMIYQNYYNAAARYMTTIDEALGTIIQGMGVVGR